MSSSTDTPRRTRVLRGVAAAHLQPLPEIGGLTAAGRRAVDPAVVAEAQATGYTAGYEVGRTDGYEAGRLEALAEAAGSSAAFAQAAAAALAALSGAATALQEREARSLAEVEDGVLSAAFDLATALLGRELELAANPGRDALARALTAAPDAGAVIARLHPEDLATLGDHADLTPGRDVTLVADPAVERGGCVLDIGESRIDAQLSTALLRVKDVLGR